MSKQDIKYYLHPDELSVLLAGRGVSRFFGLSRINYQVDDKGLCIALHNMYVNQLIQNENNEGFIIDAELAEILDILRDATEELVIQFKKSEAVLRRCYIPGEYTLVLEESADSQDKIVLYYLEGKDWLEDIKREAREADMEIVRMNPQNGVVGETRVYKMGETLDEAWLRQYFEEAKKA